MWLMLWFTLALATPAQLPAATTAPPAPASSKVWIGRYKEFEDLLLTASFERFQTTPVGVLAPRHGYFAPGSLIDHSRAFTTLMTMPFEKQSMRIDRPFFDRMKALDRNTLKREIGDLVEGGAIDALLSRRNTIVKTFEKLAATKGEAQVCLP
jgi:hypothetical protein